jgi:hypothetical protein
MKLQHLIKSHNWLSIELTLLNLYPDQIEIISEYRNVFEKIQLLEPVENDMLIVITEYESDTLEKTEEQIYYVDVSGRKLINDPTSCSNSYAIEFESWEKWLGMELAPETLENFNELEIVSHCLFEMTFCGYEEEEIQEQFQALNKTVENYNNLSDEEKRMKTHTFEELKSKIEKKGSG